MELVVGCSGLDHRSTEASSGRGVMTTPLTAEDLLRGSMMTEVEPDSRARWLAATEN